MSIPLNVIHLKNRSIFEQLQLEEALLRSDQENWFILNEGSPPAIVMGISGKPELLINGAHFAKNPIPVIRRFSGGGTVILDENSLLLSFVCNSDELNVPSYPDKVMCWNKEFLNPIFSQKPFFLRENDFALDGKKFGGNAQYFRKNRWLQHTSLLWDFCPDRMNYLLLPPKMPTYRAERSHSDFLCKLKDHFQNKLEIIDRLFELLHKQFKVNQVKIEDARKILDRPHRKATTFVEIKTSERGLAVALST